MKFISVLHIISILFVLWSNSRFAPIGKNAGFFCNDQSITEPYHGDSISLAWLLMTLLGGTPLFIYMFELIFQAPSFKEKDYIKESSFKWHLRHFYSGFLVVITITEILKFSYWELRPHFLTTCQPDMKLIACSDGLVTDFNCTGNGPDWLVKRDIYKSFPSGHASLSFYTFIFLSIYVCYCSKHVTEATVLYRRISVLAVPLTWSIVCCISRLVNRRHFWWDVLFGVFIGLIVGLIMGTFSVCKVNQRKVKRKVRIK